MKPRKNASVEASTGDYEFKVNGSTYTGKLVKIHFPSGSVVGFVSLEAGVGPVAIWGIHQVHHWESVSSLDQRRMEPPGQTDFPDWPDLPDDSDPKELAEAHQEGAMARLGQAPVASCPYPAGSATREAWVDGYASAGAS